MYREFEESDDELKLAKLSALISVKVSEPSEVSTIEEDKLCRPGSLKKVRLLLLKKL